ncbi:hypothetical protein [Bradyrhizobium sp. CCBAU 51753]|uniref:hypothetical protein n=1 Tax=Bradyrhizobium sp. CCBAU 51753 TaxID=1325100 RepID=UPI0035300F8F
MIVELEAWLREQQRLAGYRAARLLQVSGTRFFAAEIIGLVRILGICPVDLEELAGRYISAELLQYRRVDFVAIVGEPSQRVRRVDIVFGLAVPVVVGPCVEQGVVESKVAVDSYDTFAAFSAGAPLHF